MVAKKTSKKKLRKKKAKNPPPKKISLAVPGVKAKLTRPPKENPIAANDDIDNAEPDLTSLMYLRHAAGMHYIHDLNGCSVSDMLKHPVYGIVNRDTMQYWCGTDKWGVKRAAFKEDIRKRLSAKLGDKIVKARIRQYEAFERVWEIGIQKVESNIVDSNSWEGVVNALAKWAVIMDDYRSKISEQVIPFTRTQIEATNASQIRPKLTEDEAREAATLIIRRRREEMRRKMAEESGQPIPELKLLPGSGK